VGTFTLPEALRWSVYPALRLPLGGHFFALFPWEMLYYCRPDASWTNRLLWPMNGRETFGGNGDRKQAYADALREPVETFATNSDS